MSGLVALACAGLLAFGLYLQYHLELEPCPMCMATCYWAGIEQVFYAATVEDALEYGNFDDRPIYEQLALPKEQRSIKMTQMLQKEAVDVWKQYKAKPDKVPY